MKPQFPQTGLSPFRPDVRVVPQPAPRIVAERLPTELLVDPCPAQDRSLPEKASGRPPPWYETFPKPLAAYLTNRRTTLDSDRTEACALNRTVASWAPSSHRPPSSRGRSQRPQRHEVAARQDTRRRHPCPLHPAPRAVLSGSTAGGISSARHREGCPRTPGRDEPARPRRSLLPPLVRGEPRPWARIQTRRPQASNRGRHRSTVADAERRRRRGHQSSVIFF